MFRRLVICKVIFSLMLCTVQTLVFDSINPEFQIVHLPNNELEVNSESVDNPEQEKIFDFSFQAFGRNFDLKLTKNNLLSPSFKSYVMTGQDQKVILDRPRRLCHFLNKNSDIIAAISACDGEAIHGLILSGNETIEISPLNTDSPLYTEALNSNDEFQEYSSFTRPASSTPHIVKRSSIARQDFMQDYVPLPEALLSDNEHFNEKRYDAMGEKYGHFDKMYERTKIKSSIRNYSPLTLEVALFFDEAAYKIFAPYMKYDDAKLQDMILAYLNGVQALYHHSSLGRALDIVLVRLEIMKSQPGDMYHYEGERSKLLDSFCAYQRRNNPGDDSHPEHWDMALYVSGLDFYAYENGRKSTGTMGLATVGGVCLSDYNCIIAELGTTNVFGKPYPSAGFTSVYILAHEIGHNLGMHHDSTGNSCSKEGYIMSPSRGTNGETQWSSCSADIMKQLDRYPCLKDTAKPSSASLNHNKFSNSPGTYYTAKKQCEILLRDSDALMAPNQKLDTICYNLQCKTPHKSGFYFAGPALEGTQCGNGKYCAGGDCLKTSPPNHVAEIPGGWGPWINSGCSSFCLQNSLGYKTRRRVCNKPAPLNTDIGCQGLGYEVTLCDDKKLCNNDRRKNITQFASEKCRDFSKLLPELDDEGIGLQAPHEELRLWMSCAIFCRRKDSGSFFTPRFELNDLGESPYFPDGTWCHNSGRENFYCKQHHCLPESFHLSKVGYLEDLDLDARISQNARPNIQFPADLRRYFSLNPNGKPMKTRWEPDEMKGLFRDEQWQSKDYLELPPNLKNKFD